jgi:hypothetical protein
MPRSPGRKSKIDSATLRRLYDEFLKANPNGTQEEFGKRVGYSRSQLNRIINGRETKKKEPEPMPVVAPTETQSEEKEWEPAPGSDLLVLWT